MNSDKTTCLEDCNGYPITGQCPPGGSCTPCPNNSTKKRLDSCDTAKGWTKSGNTCVAAKCPAGYDATITTCSSSSTKPNLETSGYSGGKVCGRCVCANVNSSCTSVNYPFTSVPQNATATLSCTTGCGSDKITRYQISCNAGYALMDGKCTGCADGGYKDSVPSGNICTKVAYNGMTCYDNCLPNNSCESGLTADDSDKLIYNKSGKAVGFTMNGHYYVPLDNTTTGHSGGQITWCANQGAEVPSYYMTSYLKKLDQTALPTSVVSALTYERGWWTSSRFDNHGGFSCGTKNSSGTECGTCYTKSNGYCCSLGADASPSAQSDGCTLPYTLCVKRCEQADASCEAKGYLRQPPTDYTCDTVQDGNSKCYTNCRPLTCADGGYRDSVRTGYECSTVTFGGKTCYKCSSCATANLSHPWCRKWNQCGKFKKCVKPTRSNIYSNWSCTATNCLYGEGNDYWCCSECGTCAEVPYSQNTL